MNTVQELQVLRAALISEIDEKIGEMIRQLQQNLQCGTETPEPQGARETIYPLRAVMHIAKGKKPSGFILADENRVDVGNWKELVTKLLRECNRDPAVHRALLESCGRIRGRSRVLLGSDARGMHTAAKIDRDIYVEVHYDAQTLLKNLEKILEAAGYQSENIKVVVVRN